MKQTANYIGQLANQQAVTVTKESGAGPALWIINNQAVARGRGSASERTSVRSCRPEGCCEPF
jgi:hypothetical protein